MENRQKKVGSKVLLFWNRGGNQNTEPEQNNPEKVPLHKHPHAHRWALAISGSVLLVLLVTWITGSTLLRKEQVGNASVSANLTEQELKDVVEQQAAEYRLRITNKDGLTKEYSLSEIGVSVSIDESSKQTVSEARSLKNRVLWWQKQNARIRTVADESKLDAFVQQKIRTEITPMKNALLEVTPEGLVQVTEEQTGRELNIPNPRNSILTTVADFRTSPLVVSEQVVPPVITKALLQDEKNKLEKIIAQKVVFKLDDKTVDVSSREIASWLTLAPDEQKQTYIFSVDQGKVQDTINKISSSNIKKTRNQIVSVAKDGSSTIVVAGINGVDIGNKEEAAKEVVTNLLSAKGLAVSLKVATTPFKTTTITAGDKLLQVNTSTKRMYAYENNTLIRTFLISAGAPATPTVTGRFSIYAKYRSQNMRGFNADGSTYFQPNVQWVNYFYRDYAVHGNYWRPLSYFGSVNSSHGCVGIVNSDAEWIYDWAPIGTPVVVTN